MSERGATEADESSQFPTMLRQKGIRRRMKCSGSVAHNIEEAFASVPQLIEAVEADEDLTDVDGIGPATAEKIMDWWENREERERNMPGASVTECSFNSATISFHSSWADELEIEVDDNAE